MAAVLPRLQPGKWQIQVYVPKHLRPFVTPGKNLKALRRDISAKDHTEAQKQADEWQRKLHAEWANINAGDAIPHGRQSIHTRADKLDELIREAARAQDKWEQFSPYFPTDYIKARQLTTDLDKAKLALVRYIARNAEKLIRDLGGRVREKDRE